MAKEYLASPEICQEGAFMTRFNTIRGLEPTYDLPFGLGKRDAAKSFSQRSTFADCALKARTEHPLWQESEKREKVLDKTHVSS